MARHGADCESENGSVFVLLSTLLLLPCIRLCLRLEGRAIWKSGGVALVMGASPARDSGSAGIAAEANGSGCFDDNDKVKGFVAAGCRRRRPRS